MSLNNAFFKVEMKCALAVGARVEHSKSREMQWNGSKGEVARVKKHLNVLSIKCHVNVGLLSIRLDICE